MNENPQEFPALGEAAEVEAQRLEDPGQRARMYADLLELEKQVLARMQELAAQRPPEQRAVVEKSNIEPLEQLIAEFEERLRFWRDRQAEQAADQ